MLCAVRLVELGVQGVQGIASIDGEGNRITGDFEGVEAARLRISLSPMGYGGSIGKPVAPIGDST